MRCHNLGNRTCEASALWMDWKHSHFVTNKSQPSHATEIVVLDFSWLNSGPEQWVWASTPRKARNHRGPISVVEKDLTSFLKMNRVRHCESFFFSSAWSSDVQTGPATPDKPIGSTAPGHPRCENTAMYSAWKAGICLHLRDNHYGRPFCFQAFSILGNFFFGS